MQTFVPNNVTRQWLAMETESPVIRKSESAILCRKCKKLCDKPFQLHGCGHTFCKRCLNDYFKILSSWADEPNYFSCLECGKKVKKPNLPVDKWTKAFSVYKKTKYHASDPGVWTEQEEIENASDNYEEKENVTSVSLTSDAKTERGEIAPLRKSKYLQRTAARQRWYRLADEFNSRISSDRKECLYFGGDIMPNGSIILADWMNFSLKLFDFSGQFVCSRELKEAPLAITVVRNDMIVVSFGSTCQNVLFLSYIQSAKVLDMLGSTSLPGYLYNTTKYEDGCIGIFERDGKSPSIARVSLDLSAGKSGSKRRSLTNFLNFEGGTALSSESSIFYDAKEGKLYVTSRRYLLCFNKGRELVFKKRFDSGDRDFYFLGSVTCDKNVTYVSSDNCFLRLNKDGDLITVVPTLEDPYHLLMRNDKPVLVLIGRQDNVVCHKI